MIELRNVHKSFGDGQIPNEVNNKNKCLLLFSGGRDSTVSAAYLAEKYDYLHLVTIQSAHLIHIENVYKRLEELKSILKGKSTWELYKKIENIPVQNLKITTCLPCHAYYIALLENLAFENNIQNISLGYVGYQNCWEEQSEYAKDSLKKYFDKIGLNLLLPVESIDEKEKIKQELKKYELSEESLEQKCSNAFLNSRLPDFELEKQIDYWICEIERISSIIKEEYKMTLIDEVKI